MKQDNLVVCDTEDCDYVVVNKTKNPFEELAGYVGVPCPKCGANLLEEKDYENHKFFLEIISKLEIEETEPSEKMVKASFLFKDGGMHIKLEDYGIDNNETCLREGSGTHELETEGSG